MVNQYVMGQSKTIIKCDLAGEAPLYLYWSKKNAILLYSDSIKKLLDDTRIPKPLKIENQAISFLLQSGVVPPPKTAYQDVYIISIGDTAECRTVNDSIEVIFEHKFPFMNANRFSKNDMQPDEDLILQMLADATISRTDESKPSYLFHSAGKDSNSIVLALAEAGWQDKVTLITHKSTGVLDESEISAKIAKNFGFKHEILYEVSQLKNNHKQAINDYFVEAPFPCTDNVTLAYPLYAEQIPKLKGSNIIDGGGNDSYMMMPLSRKELNVLPLSKYSSQLSFIRSIIKSENLFNPLLKTPAEWYGMSGLSLRDANKIFSSNTSVYPYWLSESAKREEWANFDFKTDVLTTIIAAELHIRKARNFTDSIGSKLILPFTNQKIAEYFAKMPECYLFDQKTLRNKLVLRSMLKKRMNLDSDRIGKMGWTYNSRDIILQNWKDIFQEIQVCKLWNQNEVLKLISRLESTMKSHHKYADLSGRLIYRIYLLSAWMNRSKYLNG